MSSSLLFACVTLTHHTLCIRSSSFLNDSTLQNTGADDIIIASSDMDLAKGEHEQGSGNLYFQLQTSPLTVTLSGQGKSVTVTECHSKRVSPLPLPDPRELGVRELGAGAVRVRVLQQGRLS